MYRTHSMKAQSLVGRRIRRTRELTGLVVPAVIRNGGSYFFINLNVYEDGVVDCWEMVDLDLLADKVDSGWLVPAIPNGEEISIHGLGAWIVEDGSWEFTEQTLLKHFRSVVRELNPKMRNLYSFHGNNMKVGKIQTSILSMGNPKPYRVEESDRLQRGVPGESLSVFLKTSKKRIYLADLRVFEDGTIELGRTPKVEVVTFEKLAEMAKEGRLMTAPEEGTRVGILGLGEFTLGTEGYATDIGDLLLEVRDLLLKLQGEPDSIQACRSAYEDYCSDPTHEGVERLRAAYEAVPEHNRLYVGDMDTKDIPIRMIIYGDDEIESWSHRLVARNQGMELPTITVPRPAGGSSEDDG